MSDFTPTNEPATHPVPAYLATLARSGAMALVGYLVGKGIIPSDLSGEVETALIAAVPVIWGLITQYSRRKELKAAIAAPPGLAK